MPKRTRKKPAKAPGSNAQTAVQDGTKKGPSKPQKRTKGPKKSKKYLQIKELMLKYKPVTINGLPISTLCQQTEESNETKAIEKYLVKKLTNDPNEPLYISFILIPSDPEFPFDLDVLKISLCVPPLYGVKRVVPSIYVLNDEIPRGYAANIESGFKTIADLAIRGVQVPDMEIGLVGGIGLLNQIMTLDKHLEDFLRMEKRKTIKFVVNKPTSTQSSREATPTPKPKPAKPKAKSSSPAAAETKILLVDERRRNLLIEQFTQKLDSSVKLFNKSKMYTKFKVWLPVNSTVNVPKSWIDNGKLELILSIPISYPQGKLTVSIPSRFSQLMGLHEEQEINLVKNFGNIQLENDSIISYVNYLSNNIGTFCLSSSEFEHYQQLTTAFRTT